MYTQCIDKYVVSLIRSLGGQVSWDNTVAIGSTYQDSDETITHHIIDRPAVSNQYLSRSVLTVKYNLYMHMSNKISTTVISL